MYTNTEGNPTQVQTLEGSKFYHKISNDGKEIIIGQNQSLIIYNIDCDEDAGEFLNTTSNICEVCNNSINYYLDDMGACLYCNPSTRTIINGKCEDCTSLTDYTINNGVC